MTGLGDGRVQASIAMQASNKSQDQIQAHEQLWEPWLSVWLQGLSMGMYTTGGSAIGA